MPRYAGRVNCIYIDPPYNTGNENWVYNDNVNNPMMKEWLKDKSPVDGEDLERHEKWLCMMWPRLHLLRELLAEDGVIFVSIDDHEQHRLRMVMDEIFGEGNFVASNTWQKKVSPSNDAKYFSYDHEYVTVYAKHKETWRPNRLLMTEKQKGYYKNPDNDPRGLWNSSTYTCNKTRKERPNLYYPITNPHTGEKIYPKETAVWAYSKEICKQHQRDGLIYWGSLKTAKPRFKKFLKDAKKIVPRTVWQYTDVGHTQSATQEIQALFDREVDTFNTPKPSTLIAHILQIGSNKDSIVLDSFAGSGTTAHAVLKLNKEDGGNRKFILVECEDYANKITAERVRRVIKGVPKSKDENLKKGLGGSFTYCTLGDEISTENMLTGKNLPDYEAFARHVLFTAKAHSPDNIRKARGKDGFFYEAQDCLFYLIYAPDLGFLRSNESALDIDRAQRIAKQVKAKKKRGVVFAAQSFVGQKELTKMDIAFVQLPYDVGTGIK